MNKPFSSLPIWAVLAIAFGIALTAGLAIKLMVVENVITAPDGQEYLKASFFKHLTKAEATKVAEAAAKQPAK